LRFYLKWATFYICWMLKSKLFRSIHNHFNHITWFCRNFVSVSLFATYQKFNIIIIIIIINSYSLWHRFETTYAKKTTYFTERKIFKKKKNSFTLFQSSIRSLNDITSFKRRMNDVFILFIYCFFQYQELKIVCVTDQTSEMLNI
jgi:hypothetical protein